VALVFIIEAFLLMFLFAWVIRYLGFRSPGWLAFIIMSLLGSMVFSVPAFLFSPAAALAKSLNAMTATPNLHVVPLIVPLPLFSRTARKERIWVPFFNDINEFHRFDTSRRNLLKSPKDES